MTRWPGGRAAGSMRPSQHPTAGVDHYSATKLEMSPTTKADPSGSGFDGSVDSAQSEGIGHDGHHKLPVMNSLWAFGS